MFILSAFNQFIWSHGFYFSHFLLLGISIPITIIRTYQALYKNKMKKPWLILTEIIVELTRVIQYILAIAIGTHTTISSLFSSGLWQDMFSGINQITVPDVIWEAVGFVIIFAIYNVILFRILKKSTVAAFMKRANITHFEVASFQTAMILAYKNLFLIPVSMIYLFNILKLI